MDTSRAELVRVDGSGISLLESLLVLFLHDLSARLPAGALRLGADGRWDWELSAAAWVLSQRRDAWFIRVGDQSEATTVGMVLVSEDLHLRDGPDRSVDAYFVLAPYRRSGLGSAGSVAYALPDQSDFGKRDERREPSWTRASPP